MSEQQFNREVDRALKYSREKLPVSAIHPQLRFTRLGAVLREHAAEDSTVGSLAHAALTQPHDQPLELMPLHALRDYMQDYPEHPLANKLNWERLPEQVELQSRMESLIGQFNRSIPGAATLHPIHVQRPPANIDLSNGVVSIRNRLHKEFPDATPADLDNAANRLRLRDGRARLAEEEMGWNPTGPETTHDQLAIRNGEPHPLFAAELF